METNTNIPAPKESIGKVPKKRSIFVIIGIVVVIIILALLAYFVWWRFVQPAFVIDGHSYSKTAYYNMMASAKKSGVSQKDATSQYIEIEKKRIAAEKMNLQPTPNQIENSQANSYPSTLGKDLSIWQKEVSYGNAIAPAIAFAKQGGYTGAYFKFPFAIHQEALPYQYRSGEKKVPDGWRDPKVVQSDKDYAKQVAEKDRERIKQGASSEEVIAEITADSRLGRLGSSNGSLVFSINQAGVDYLGAGIATDLSSKFDQKILQKENTVKLTEIMTGKIMLQDLPGRPQVDGYYYFVQIDKYQKANSAVQAEYDKAIGELKVQKNV